jgi:hypothetical protein
MIIAAYSGVGKSTFAAMNPEKSLDFVAMPYKYFLDYNGDDGESGKANPDNVMRPDWPFNYVAAIQEILSEDKFILIPSDIRVLKMLRADAVSYVLVYPRRDAKGAYRKRFIDRGNTDAFISVFIGHWEYFLDTLEKDPSERHIVLQPHQFISDVINMNLFYPSTGEFLR